MSAYKAVASDWVRVTGPHVLCADQHCTFYYHGDTDPDAHRASNAARLHVEQTGHDVHMQEGRDKLFTPQTSVYPDD
jgi:hypothetical protein